MSTHMSFAVLKDDKTTFVQTETTQANEFFQNCFSLDGQMHALFPRASDKDCPLQHHHPRFLAREKEDRLIFQFCFRVEQCHSYSTAMDLNNFLNLITESIDICNQPPDQIFAHTDEATPEIIAPDVLEDILQYSETQSATATLPVLESKVIVPDVLEDILHYTCETKSATATIPVLESEVIVPDVLDDIQHYSETKSATAEEVAENHAWLDDLVNVTAEKNTEPEYTIPQASVSIATKSKKRYYNPFSSANAELIAPYLNVHRAYEVTLNITECMEHLDNYVSSTHKKINKKAGYCLNHGEELLKLNGRIMTVPLFEMGEEDFFQSLKTTTSGPNSSSYKIRRVDDDNAVSRNQIRRVLKRLFDLQARIQG